MQELTLKNVVWKEGKYFVAQCLQVDISSFGETREEALQQLQEALELYFEDASILDISEVEMPEIVSSSVRYA